MGQNKGQRLESRLGKKRRQKSKQGPQQAQED